MSPVRPRRYDRRVPDRRFKPSRRDAVRRENPDTFVASSDRTGRSDVSVFGPNNFSTEWRRHKGLNLKSFAPMAEHCHRSGRREKLIKSRKRVIPSRLGVPGANRTYPFTNAPLTFNRCVANPKRRVSNKQAQVEVAEAGQHFKRVAVVQGDVVVLVVRLAHMAFNAFSSEARASSCGIDSFSHD